MMMTGNGKTYYYANDAAGRLTNHAVNGNSRTFGYSFRAQMTSLSDTNAQVFTYAFDGDGNRISQSLNDCLHARYIYDGPNVVLELNASNEVTHAVVNGPGIDQPVERIAYVKGEPRLRQVYHTDGLGSVALMTDESQAPVKTYPYDAFGRIRSETGELVMNRWTYTGRGALGDSAGLYYYRWRVMDPNTGRFISEDPLGFVDGPNRYAYVGNDPANLVDVYGLNWFRPPKGKYVVGRPNHPIVRPGTGLGKFLDDYCPDANTLGRRHDAFVGFMVPDLGDDGFGKFIEIIVDIPINIPTIPIVYVEAVIEETIKSPFRLIRSLKPDKNPDPCDECKEKDIDL